MKKVILIMITLLISSFASAETHSDTKTEDNQRSCKIVLDTSLTQDVLPAWLAYGGTRALWYEETFFEKFPGEEYYYTLEEELEAREHMARVWDELSEENTALQNNYLDDLVLVFKARFLKEYVYFYFAHPDWKVDKNELKINEFIKWARENILGHKPETLAVVSPASK